MMDGAGVRVGPSNGAGVWVVAGVRVLNRAGIRVVAGVRVLARVRVLNGAEERVVARAGVGVGTVVSTVEDDSALSISSVFRSLSPSMD